MKKKKKKNNWFIDCILGAFIGFVNGFLGSGGGSLAVPVLEKFKNLENKEAHATSLAVIFPLSIISSIIYFTTIEFEILDIIILAISVTVGGVLGCLFLKKLSNKTIRIIFACLLLVAGVKMFF